MGIFLSSFVNKVRVRLVTLRVCSIVSCLSHSSSKTQQAFQKETRIVCVGLDAAGKTTVLYKLKLGETITTIPTIGFNVETLQYKNLNLTVWDVGGQDKVSEACICGSKNVTHSRTSMLFVLRFARSGSTITTTPTPSSTSSTRTTASALAKPATS